MAAIVLAKISGYKTRGGTRVPAYREENFAVAGIILNFENMALKGLPKCWLGVEEIIYTEKMAVTYRDHRKHLLLK